MELPFSISEPRALILLLTIPPVLFLGLMSARARTRDRGRILVSTATRMIILVLITLALAGTQLITSGGPVSVVFLVDRSASMSQASRDASLQYVRQAIASMGPNDQAGVVLFGEEALVDRALSADTEWNSPGKAPAALATNIADAIQIGSALFPEGGGHRLVLLSDGVETVGQAREVVGRSGLLGVQFSVVPLGSQSRGEVTVDKVVSPNSVPAKQQAQVRVLVKSNTDRAAKLELFDDDALVAERDLQLKAGSNVEDFSVNTQNEGFHVFKARVISVDDQHSENNEALSFTVVKKPPSVLVLAGSPEDAAPLKVALTASGITVDVGEPNALPRDPDKLASYDAVVLANTSAEALGMDGQQVLQSYVRDLGHGLIMIGGDTSYGAGGYLRSPLEEVMPVSMDVRTSNERASLAMTFVVDKSGSMGRCHCGANQTFNPSMRTEFGDSKIELVKQAIAKATALMNSADQVGVVAFDEQVHWLANLQPIGQLGEQHLQLALQPLAAEGNTNMSPALSSAVDALQVSTAKQKHIVLLGDGWTQQADFGALLNRMAENNITMSTVGVGDGASDLLRDLADKGGGKYYKADDVKKVPDLLLRETIRLTGQYFVEQPFRPSLGRASPILNGIDAARLPDLLGYNASTPKPDAEVVLKSPLGDPILAQWQYGLGRAVAWTSDAKGRWATNWIEWPNFARFVGQMINWTLPSSATQGIETSFSPANGELQGGQDVGVRIDSTTSTGAPRNSLQTSVMITGTGQAISSTATVSQRSPGVYDGVARGLKQGAYSVLVEQRDPASGRVVAREQTGFIVPYPSEYRLDPDAQQSGLALLSDLAQIGGGKSLDISQPSAAFSSDMNLQPVRVALWPWLLLASVLLFPLDVALRRLTASPVQLWHLLRGRENVT